MRVAINCRSFLKKSCTGIGRYAYNLVRSLSEIDRHNQYFLYAPRKIFDPSRRTPHFDAGNFRTCVDYWRRGVEAVTGPVDVYHAPSPEDLGELRARVVVTVHDLIYKTYPAGHTDETCETADRQLKNIVARADKIICCSQATLADLKKYFSVDEKKTSCIPQGVDKQVFYPLNDDSRRQAVRRLSEMGVRSPFVLFVGTREPRKNLDNLLEAFAQVKARKTFSGSLVCAGMKGWGGGDEEQRLRGLGLGNDVTILGYVTDDDLRVLYNLAEVFVFPSFYEGFGFPIVEAFACGAAVITSNVSACGEVAGDAALTVDPRDPSSISAALERVLGDEILRSSMRQKASQRAGDFSFHRTAQQTLAVYEQVRGN